MAKSVFKFLKDEILRLRNFLYAKIYISPESKRDIVGRFHRLYYESVYFGGTWENTFWQGILTKKCPLDLWIYQEIIYELRPDLIIETGTFQGGSALFLACMCDLVNNGEIAAIDIEDRENRPRHKRIRYLRGTSTSEEVLKAVRGLAKDKAKVMVILDSDHRKENVLNELRAYSGLVTQGSYLIVEDTNINGHPVELRFGPGPMEAVEAFLKENKDFVVDKKREKFYMTFNPSGYLRRVE